MTYPMLPPEVTSELLRSGAGSAPMLEASNAWSGLANELQSAASSFSAVTSGLGQSWQGASAQAMAAAAAPYTAYLNTAAGHSQQAAAGAASVAAAFETAQTTAVPLPVVWGNRIMTRMLAATNFLGMNVQAIMAAEFQYEQMWAQNVTAMLNYHLSASSVSSQLGSIEGLLRSLPGMPKPAAVKATSPAATTPTTAPPAKPPAAPATPAGAAEKAAAAAAQARAVATLPKAAVPRVPVEPAPRVPIRRVELAE